MADLSPAAAVAQHRITPPPELFAEWFANSLKTLDRKVSRDDTGTTGLIAGEVAIQAARWGADQELEACCEYLARCAAWEPEDVQEMLDLRRPKPPSLKEQALLAIDTAVADGRLSPDVSNVVRRALEQLDD